MGRLSDAIRILESCGVAPDCVETLMALEDKHPQADDWETIDICQLQRLPVASDQVLFLIQSLPRCSSPGRDGLRSEHLQVAVHAVADHRRENFMNMMAKWLELLVNGEVSDEIRQFYASAPLTALLKPDGGVRPIAVGEIWRRLTSKLALSSVITRAINLLEPQQLGVGVPNGVERIVHEVQEWYDGNKDNEDKVLTQVDFRNAFNTLFRYPIFTQIARTFPEILRYIQYCYAKRSRLYFGKSFIWSCSGVQQGDPLGPLLFALTLLPVIQKIEEECVLDVNKWYLDDGCLAGQKQEVQKALSILERECAKIGLFLNKSKTTIFGAGSSDFAFEGLKKIEGDGIVLLGAPVGSDVFISDYAQTKIEALQNRLQLTECLQNPQYQLPLLRFCIGLPRVNHLFRLCHPEVIKEAINSCDTLLDSYISTNLFGHALSPFQRRLISLPVSQGGLGLSIAKDIALCAYTGSLFQVTKNTPSIHDKATKSLEEWNLRVQKSITTEEMSRSIHPQKLLTAKIHEATKEWLVSEHVPLVMRTRVNEVMDKDSGLWVTARPSKYHGTLLKRWEFSLALQFRYGCNLVDKEGSCSLCIGSRDIGGIHDTECKGDGRHWSRHNLVRDTLLKIVREAGYSGDREVPHLLGEESDERPADVLIRGYEGGQDLCVDVAVVSAFSSTNHLKEAEDLKRRRYESSCHTHDLRFTPFILNTLGNFGSSCVDLIKTLAVGMADRERSEGVFKFVRRIKERLQIASQRGVAWSLKNCTK